MFTSEINWKRNYTLEPSSRASSRSPAFSPAGRGISLNSTLCSFVTDSINPIALKKDDAISQTILCLHHDQQPQVRRPIYRHHGQPPTPRLAAQEQTHPRIHHPLQPDPSRLLRTLFYPDAAIAPEKEIKVGRRSNT